MEAESSSWDCEPSLARTRLAVDWKLSAHDSNLDTRSVKDDTSRGSFTYLSPMIRVEATIVMWVSQGVNGVGEW